MLKRRFYFWKIKITAQIEVCSKICRCAPSQVSDITPISMLLKNRIAVRINCACTLALILFIKKYPIGHLNFFFNEIICNTSVAISLALAAVTMPPYSKYPHYLSVFLSYTTSERIDIESKTKTTFFKESSFRTDSFKKSNTSCMKPTLHLFVAKILVM